MKTYYVCETCGKKFNDMEAAIKCEKQHEEAVAKSKRLVAEQEKRRAEVDKAYKSYMELLDAYDKDYQIHPLVRYSPLSGFFFEYPKE